VSDRLWIWAKLARGARSGGPGRAADPMRVELPLGLARIETRLRCTLRLRRHGRESAKT